MPRAQTRAPRPISELEIDDEVIKLCDLAYDECKGALNKHRKLLETVAEKLIEKET